MIRRRRAVRNLEPELKEAYDLLWKSLGELKNQLALKEAERTTLTKSIDNEILDIQNKIQKIDSVMASFMPKAENIYDPNTGWKQKIIWVLKNENKLMSISDISKVIKEKEQDIEIDVIPTIRLTCKRMVEKNELKEHSSPNVKVQHFGLNEWFENNGDLIETYYK